MPSFEGTYYAGVIPRMTWKCSRRLCGIEMVILFLQREAVVRSKKLLLCRDDERRRDVTSSLGIPRLSSYKLIWNHNCANMKMLIWCKAYFGRCLHSSTSRLHNTEVLKNQSVVTDHNMQVSAFHSNFLRIEIFPFFFFKDHFIM